jgi:hypothetical protein
MDSTKLKLKANAYCSLSIDSVDNHGAKEYDAQRVYPDGFNIEDLESTGTGKRWYTPFFHDSEKNIYVMVKVKVSSDNIAYVHVSHKLEYLEELMENYHNTHSHPETYYVGYIDHFETDYNYILRVSNDHPEAIWYPT